MMMKKASIIFCVIACFLVTTKSYADFPVQTVSGTVIKKSARDHMFFVGEINAVSGATRVIRLRIDFLTKFFRVLNLSELEIGDTVFVEYEQKQDGEFVVKRIEVRPQAEPIQESSTSEGKSFLPSLF